MINYFKKKRKKDVRNLLTFYETGYFYNCLVYSLRPLTGSVEAREILEGKICRLARLLSHVEEVEIFVTDLFEESASRREHLFGLWKNETSPSVRRLLAREMDIIREEGMCTAQRNFYLVLSTTKTSDGGKQMERLIRSEMPEAVLLSEEEKEEVVVNFLRNEPQGAKETVAMLPQTEEEEISC